MDENKIKAKVLNILPTNVSAIPSNAANCVNVQSKDDLAANLAHSIKAAADSLEIARIRYREKLKLNQLNKKEKVLTDTAIKVGLNPEEIPTNYKPRVLQELAANKKSKEEQQKKLETLDAIEAQIVEPLHPDNLAKKGVVVNTEEAKRILAMQGTTRPEITKILTALNINLNTQLTKTDTCNLLACLLTCNTSQLEALQTNPKVPIVIKTVIKRLLEDAKLGNIGTIDKLWDRVFGKGPMQLELDEHASMQTGIIPNKPISREAYIIIRDTLLQ